MYTLLFILSHIIYSFPRADALIGNNVIQAEKDEFPFIVSIGYVHTTNTDNSHICGGALISRKHILTSEHCVYDKRARDLQVLVGSIDLQSGRKYSVASIMRFDDWTKRHRSVSYPNNDIAILTLEEYVNEVNPGLIAENSRNSDFYGKNAMTAGWGEGDDGKIPRYLQTIIMKVLNPDQCSENLYRLTRKSYQINGKYFCTSTTPYTLLSKSDEGSPILYNNLIIGVNHGTYPTYSGDDPGEQNLHIGIDSYRRFIRDVLSSE